MAIILDGKSLALAVEEELKVEVERIKVKLGFAPALATILVGDDMASVTYVNMKAKACARVGLDSKIVKLLSTTTTEELIKEINKLNNDNSVCGILLQHPVPRGIDERACFDAIDVDKDVDGVNSQTFGKMSMGEESYYSATPYGIMRLLKHYNIDLVGKHAVVVGRSAILGKPIAMMLLGADCTVTICHSKTNNLEAILRTADIVVGAVGRAKFIKSEWLKPGVVVVDAGYNEGNVGDVDLDNIDSIASAYTPVPGGVGPMTINSLILQTVNAASKLIQK
ncbi:MAG: bifunctional 5,10-methylene-tetrahydrofolate dehydrogenase/5,10-methylene-tetrahydrofolate cyclohydrolase [Clostridiales bacterium]|nr:bifunctional 5,10-methylene-tetrahydrofolate dehydrogenase/5,10-methylene-tetrahydrofolate cyclohydrolase [Clostridiales bacterium]